jgi:hypothetical protein
MGRIVAISLTHRSPFGRTFAAIVVAFVLWIAAWTLSYFLLSEGVLRALMSARVPEDVLRAGPSLALTIFEWNLVFGVGAIVVGSLFAIGPVSLGYFAPWWWALGYGVALGTNSFVVTVPGKIAPNLSILWQHIGAPEILSYVLVAAALANIHMWRPRRWYDLTLNRVRHIKEIRLHWTELACLASALTLLFWTASREAAGVIAFLN